MDISGTTQNNDESSLSENQTQELSHGQTNVVVSSGAQNANDNDISQSGNLSSNVNNASESDAGIVSDEGSLSNADAMPVTNLSLLRGVTMTSLPSSVKGPATTIDNEGKYSPNEIS